MCSIIGYIGNGMAAELLVNGLKRMEYRGYDSVGVATNHDDGIEVRKGVGKVSDVDGVENLHSLAGNIGIGHTRWATHGSVNITNAHPHKSSTGKIAIVHNGIVENYQELKHALQANGYFFRSETDSEAIANLLQWNYDRTGEIKKAMLNTVASLRGDYSFVAIFEDGSLAAARFHEPLVVGMGKNGYFVSSDVLGFVEHTDEVIYPDNMEIVLANGAGLHFFDFGGMPVRHHITKVSKEFADAYKGEYAHFTIKEIYEQPETVARIEETPAEEIEKIAEAVKSAKDVYATGSGTSYNAALVAKNLFLRYGKIRVEPVISSEARFYPDYFDERSLLIALSQSGESADVLETVRNAKARGSKVISMVNITTSSLVQVSSQAVGLRCGPEIGVAATKSFTAQLSILYKIASALSGGTLRPDFNRIAECMKEILADGNAIMEIAKGLGDASDIYILGRGAHYPIALEAALKLKELTYIHAEGLPGGELKHGPLALVDNNTPVIVINPTDSTYADMLASAHEIKARKARIIGISEKNSEVYDHWIRLPDIEEPFLPLVEIVPMQMLAYYLALERQTDPDYPRNLAKSVTVR